MGDLSPHFDRTEFRCRHCGLLPPKTRAWRHLATHLERLRAILGRPVRIVSGYRCPQHPIERAKPGGPGEHNRGAADLELGVATVEQAEAAGFTGIGNRGRWATHVDLGRRRRWAYR